jgi:hypothetical protein
MDHDFEAYDPNAGFDVRLDRLVRLDNASPSFRGFARGRPPSTAQCRIEYELEVLSKWPDRPVRSMTARPVNFTDSANQIQ